MSRELKGVRGESCNYGGVEVRGGTGNSKCKGTGNSKCKGPEVGAFLM